MAITLPGSNAPARQHPIDPHACLAPSESSGLSLERVAPDPLLDTRHRHRPPESNHSRDSIR